MYNDHFERFEAYERELESLKFNLKELLRLNRELLLHKQKTAAQVP
jgi:hypothetical protein